LEWLCHSKDLRPDLLIHANALVRSFILSSKITAAIRTFEMLTRLFPSQIFEPITTDALLAPSTRNTIAEHVMLKDYLTILNLHNTWIDHFHSRPESPASAITTTPSTPHLRGGRLPTSNRETPYSALLDHKMQMTEYIENERWWKGQFDQLTRKLTDAAYKVLLWPTGWLTGAKNAIEGEREVELEEIRKRCIPEVVLTLHSVFMKMERYTDSLGLVTLVMDPHTQLYACFKVEELQQLLRLVRQSYIKYLEIQKTVKLDPLVQ